MREAGVPASAGRGRWSLRVAGWAGRGLDVGCRSSGGQREADLSPPPGAQPAAYRPAASQHRSTGAPEHRSTGAPEHRSTGAPEHRSTGAPEPLPDFRPTWMI
ncbi:hypothetical protein EYF80_065862 [Liparis tanakae]|uniref:Uncharacterized protein n=1 Tax=Liparis tanakae TaxID=230148 RepID=A0A4Z2E5G9_9TELE|nr:hypothetical protein EYF80_065862 [Liparis tanakae]